MMLRVGIYIRVSTDEQAQEGFSIPTQINRLRAFCQSQDWVITSEYIDDGYSAKHFDEKRPQLKRLLNDVRLKQLDIVLVYRLDRIVRSVFHLQQLLATLEEHNVAFKSATEIYDTSTAMGRLFINIVGALAQWERENLAERVVVVMGEKALEGNRNGAPAPYGYEYGEDGLKLHPEQSEIARNIFTWYVEGLGIQAIIDRLYKERIKSPTGNVEWTHQGIRYMLRNPAYCGKVRWGEILSDGHHPPIIEESLFNRVQDIIEYKSNVSPSEAAGKYPFTGLLRCGKCGSKMGGRTFHKNTNHPTIYYRCRNKVVGKCDMKYIRGDTFEHDLVEFLDYLFNNVEELQTILDAQASPQKTDDVKPLKKELEKVTKQKNRWYETFNDPENPIPKSELYAIIKPLIDKEQELQTKIQLLTQKEEVSISADEYVSTYKDFKQKWILTEAPEQRKAMLQDIFEYIICLENGEYQYKFY